MNEQPDLTKSEHGYGDRRVVDWADLGREMWSFLTGRSAAINYEFVDMTVEVPRDTGPRSPRAIWKVDGSLRISTTDEGSVA